jgi:hypothetical protein
MGIMVVSASLDSPDRHGHRHGSGEQPEHALEGEEDQSRKTDPLEPVTQTASLFQNRVSGETEPGWFLVIGRKYRRFDFQSSGA